MELSDLEIPKGSKIQPQQPRIWYLRSRLLTGPPPALREWLNYACACGIPCFRICHGQRGASDRLCK
jgi:hypothetical protein